MHPAKEIDRRFHGEAANAEVTGHHALASHCFKEPEDILTLAKGIEKDRERADVHGVRAEPDQVGIEPGELCQQDADPLRLLGIWSSRSFSTARQ